MARIKIELPEKFDFSTEIPVRISDINYGGHLGHDSVLSLTHEARVRLLHKYGFTEIEIAICEFSKYGCDLTYKITEKETGREIAQAKTGIVFFDYENRKVAPVPEKFKAIFPPKETL